MIVRNTREIGGLIRQAREDAGLTQAQFAEKLNVRRQRVIYLERGDSQIQIGFVIAALHELGIEISLGGRGAKTEKSKRQPSSEAYSIDDIADGKPVPRGR